MIGQFDAFTVTENVTWEQAARQCAPYSKTPWFFLESDKECIDDWAAIKAFRPAPPTTSYTRQYIFQPFYEDRYLSDWGPIRLIHRDTVLRNEPLESRTLPIAGIKFPEHGNYPVFFVSNGETNAEENWIHLKSICPRAVRVKDIQGRWKMFQECAALATGNSHFFIVTGKNRVTDASVFRFAPDRFQPKHHWVFQAKNTTNGLEYGHMGVVLYSWASVVNTPKDFGLDFTMASPFHSIFWTVSEAHYATSPWEAFRTAYREAYKLTEAAKYGDDIADMHLRVWLDVGVGEFGTFSTWGAWHGMMDSDRIEGHRTVEWSDLEGRLRSRVEVMASLPNGVDQIQMHQTNLREEQNRSSHRIPTQPDVGSTTRDCTFDSVHIAQSVLEDVAQLLDPEIWDERNSPES